MSFNSNSAVGTTSVDRSVNASVAREPALVETIELASVRSDVLDVMTQLRTINKGYGVSTEYLLKSLPVNNRWRYEQVIDGLLANNSLISSKPYHYTGYGQILRTRLSAPIPALLVVASNLTKTRTKKTKAKTTNRSIAILELFKQWLLSLAAASKLTNDKTTMTAAVAITNNKNMNNQQLQNQHNYFDNGLAAGNWLIFSDYLDDLQALKNAGLVIFDPVYMTVTPTSFGRWLISSRSMVAAANSPHKSLRWLSCRLLFKDAGIDADSECRIERTLCTLLNTEKTITVGKFRRYIFSLLDRDQPQTVKSLYQLINQAIDRVIKSAVADNKVTISDHQLTDNAVLTANYDRHMLVNDIVILGGLYQRTAFKPARYSDIVADRVRNCPVVAAQFTPDNVSIMLKHIQHLFQLLLLRDNYEGLVMSAEAQYIAVNIADLHQYQLYQERINRVTVPRPIAAASSSALGSAGGGSNDGLTAFNNYHSVPEARVPSLYSTPAAFNTSYHDE